MLCLRVLLPRRAEVKPARWGGQEMQDPSKISFFSIRFLLADKGTSFCSNYFFLLFWSLFCHVSVNLGFFPPFLISWLFVRVTVTSSNYFSRYSCSWNMLCVHVLRTQLHKIQEKGLLLLTCPFIAHVFPYKNSEKVLKKYFFPRLVHLRSASLSPSSHGSPLHTWKVRFL